MGKIILASSSPRRADIMKKTKYKFRVIPSPYQENDTRTDFSFEIKRVSEVENIFSTSERVCFKAEGLAFIEDLAYQKAKAVLPLVDESSLIIGADTLVISDGKILGKPKDKKDAFRMLKELSGKKHFVVTSIAVINSETGEVKQNSTTSIVEFENLTDEQIDYYIEKYNPLDKAGSYGIQEMPEGYIKSYEGSLENIIGMCPEALKKLL